MAAQACVAEAGDAARVSRLAGCAAAEARAVELSETQGRRDEGVRRAGALVRAARRAAEEDGVDPAIAEGLLSRAMNGVATRSLTFDPPGVRRPAPSTACPEVAVDRGELPDGVRR